MEYVYPDYYRQFTCIGGECPDTCCAGWEIVIDDKTLEKYKKYPGGFGNRLRNSINFKRKSFKQYDRRCAFLNEENLCDIYTEAGEKLFCKTCRQYPRHEEEYENVSSRKVPAWRQKMAEKQSAKKAKKMLKEVEKFILNSRKKKN